ncbi:6-phospho-beta-galactosidase [Bacillus sp. HMF5848]|uniref:6-phospho-beta-galactosidase n=1 Tax=Bacillus sp. HMF5848 TaxID=2495421 RepID=UPI000F776AA6|nr:6-phospho-beta-galactosidase [Bacillus sp. HMF5848]RSK28793.1 6-phospho-beta-galactosidase [Bacillus sp. HMF5848]
MKTFNSDFLFGAATAAYQSEGATTIDGRGPCYWDEYLHRDSSTFHGDIASDFYHTYKQDIRQAKAFGIDSIRISIAWTRILPNGIGPVNQAGVQFYRDVFDECRENGVEPFVTLHHFDTPLPLFKKGDWLNKDNIDHFVNYAKVCFQQFGDQVKHWITINEPWSVVAGQYVIGHFPPNIQYDVPKAIQAMHNMSVAHAKVVNLYKDMQLDGEIGIVHILESKYANSESENDKKAAQLEDTLANRFVLDACLKGKYSEETVRDLTDIIQASRDTWTITDEELNCLSKAAVQIDFLGLNYYASHFIEHYEGDSFIGHNGTGEKGTSVFALKGIGKRVKNQAVPTTDWDWPIFPKGLFDMLLRIKNEYPAYKKIYVTENGLGYKDAMTGHKINDLLRIQYVHDHLAAILEAIDAGVNVKGYFIWSLMDVLSWTNGFNKRYGLFYVDFETQERYPKRSAYWYKQLSSSRVLLGPQRVEF